MRSGECLRLTRGWYAAARAEPLTARARHALTATALARANPRTVVSHHSALVLHELPTYAVDLTTVHLTSLPRPSGGRVPNSSARRRGLVVHRPVPTLALSRSPVTDASATVTISLAWAVVQTGLVHGAEGRPPTRRRAARVTG